MSVGPLLVVAAHPDDEVLGCGGVLARESASGRLVHVLILADGETSRAGGEAALSSRREAAYAAADVLGVASVNFLNMPDNQLDNVPLLTVIKGIEAEMARIGPESVLTHHARDVNVDHVIAHEAVLAACRPLPESVLRELLFFEIPSSTEWRPDGAAASFAPNVFVDISDVMQLKLKALKTYAHELRAFPHPRSLEAVEALATWRGATVGVARAEAFMLGRCLR
jgi:LmbE family N-acetylglucosaminyl deacetylase